MDSPSRTELDAALKLMYPYGHIMITDSDREALVKRNLCTTRALAQLVDDYSACVALTDVSERTQGMLAEGGCLGRCTRSIKQVVMEPMAPFRGEPMWEEDTMSGSWQDAVMVDTITHKRAWPGFKESAQQLFDGLDDIQCFDRSNFPSIAALSYLATEHEVSMACRNQLAGVNTIAEMLSPFFWSMIGFGGVEWSFSHANLLVRVTTKAPGPQLQLASQSDIARVSAVIKAMSSSDFDIARGDTWATILADPKKLERVQLGLQQAFGCAVEEEVAVAAVTNYTVTLFIKRSMDVMDKTIYVSDPVWFDQTQPPAKACWLTFLHEAQLCYPAKATLARELVPFSGLGCKPMINWKGTGQPPWVSEPPLKVSASFERLAIQAPLYGLAFADLNETAIIHSGNHAIVKEGMTDGVKTIIKTYKGGDEEAEEAYEAELEAYQSLQALQGIHIPRLLCYGPLQDTCDPTLVLEHCGTSLDDMPSLTPCELRKLREDALIPLRAMHNAGALHGDIAYRNIVYDSSRNRTILIDLQTISFPTGDKVPAFEEEESELLGDRTTPDEQLKAFITLQLSRRQQ